MTVTIRHLEGIREPLDITIAAQINNNWNTSNITGSVKPVIEALSYIPAMNIDEDNQSGVNIIKISALRRYRDEEEPNGDDSHQWFTDVEIDVWAESVILLQQFEDEINRILWEKRPNENTRLLKSSGTQVNPPLIGTDDSEVESFKMTEIDFEFQGSTGDGSGSSVSSLGVLICAWFKLKT